MPPPVSRGGDAIQTHLERADGGEADSWYHPRPTRSFSGAGPVEAVALHRVETPPHWHLVTFGLTELHAKDSPDRYISGWGFELTFRVVSDDRPLWAVDFLASLAAYVWSGQHPFAPGHLMDLRGPVKLDSTSDITAALVVDDPVLRPLDGPFGSVEFLQVVGLTADELELCRAWSPEGVQDLLARQDPLLITSLDRPSVAADPRWQEEIASRSRQDGSSLTELRVGTLRVKPGRRQRVEVEMGAGAATALGPALRRELLADGASFSVIGDDAEVRFLAGADAGWEFEDERLTVTVPLHAVKDMAGLFDGRTGWGHLPEWPALRFRVKP